ncbi:hypothetical protein [Azonexus sp. R2A61]|uniref:hypothetical protein n=1 Tax=Azonexus sp. R2A61 TaxID=2744443 RepID=UPI001F405580|nr:hypothetical protein [Azonexus sp. R2A61]
MLKENFMVGPFEVRPRSGGRVDISYGLKTLASNIDTTGITRHEVADSLGDCFAQLRDELRAKTELHPINLMQSGNRIAGFVCESSIVEGMTAGLIDDRAEFWLQSDNRLYSMPVSIDGYASIRSTSSAAPLCWVRNLLPVDVVTTDPEQWRAPSSWEIRHVVGEGSFTGISGAKAAALVGMTPQNFRKYTATDGASTRQNISFAAWHLLLKKLGVTR